MRSLERNLLAWILGVLAAGGLLVAFILYMLLLEQLNESYDDDLQNIASAVSAYNQRRSVPVTSAVEVPEQETAPVLSPDDPADVVTATWSNDGRRLYTSDPRVKLPFVATGGTSYPSIGGEAWIMYTTVRPDGTVQAAQRRSARYAMAAHTAAQLVVPLLLLAAAVGTLFVVALRRGLRPLEGAAHDIAAKSAGALTPLKTGNTPSELLPLVASINGLIERLSTAFDQQRRFMADAAHELRTPITALRLQLGLLNDAESDLARSEAIRHLTSGVARAQHLTEQLLQVARSEPGGHVSETHAVDLGEIARYCVGSFDTRAKSVGIDLGAVVHEPVIVEGDVEQLTVLVNNLIDNAIRYTPSGGQVDVRVARQGDMSALIVSDDGAGIPPDERTRVFDRFYRGVQACTSTSDATGSGLGLAIVKAIADQHGARIHVRSGPRGVGTSVEVIFVERGVVA